MKVTVEYKNNENTQYNIDQFEDVFLNDGSLTVYTNELDSDGDYMAYELEVNNLKRIEFTEF